MKTGVELIAEERQRQIDVKGYSEQHDAVNHPSHYASGKIECIDAMEAAYGTEAVMHFCQCNAFKYQWRFNKKNGEEDIKKAQWYQNKYLELQNKLEAKKHFSNSKSD